MLIVHPMVLNQCWNNVLLIVFNNFKRDLINLYFYVKFRRKNPLLLILFSIENHKSHDLYTCVLIGCPPPLNKSLKHLNCYAGRDYISTTGLALSWVAALLQKQPSCILEIGEIQRIIFRAFFPIHNHKFLCIVVFKANKLTVSRVDSSQVGRNTGVIKWMPSCFVL